MKRIYLSISVCIRTSDVKEVCITPDPLEVLITDERHLTLFDINHILSSTNVFLYLVLRVNVPSDENE